VAVLTGTIVATSGASGPSPTAAAAAGLSAHDQSANSRAAGNAWPGAHLADAMTGRAGARSSHLGSGASYTASGAAILATTQTGARRWVIAWPPAARAAVTAPRSGQVVAGHGRPAVPVHQAGPAHSSRSGQPAHPATRLASAARPVHTTQPAARAKPAQPARPQHASAPPPNPCATATLQGWICQAVQVLQQHGTPSSAVSASAAYIVVQHESNGNPRAYNGWDSNAAAGHPSEGIAQVIGPTFQAYALPGHSDIWNPVDNMIAAFRYAISRYGSMNNIPGVVAVRQGGSYMGY
jgi:hypothetical protein